MRGELMGPMVEEIPPRYLELIKKDIRKVLGRGDDRTVLMVLNEVENRRRK